MSHVPRTRRDNDRLALAVCRALSEGGIIKTVAATAGVPENTLHKIMTRQRKRYGFRSMYQMVAVYAREGKFETPEFMMKCKQGHCTELRGGGCPICGSSTTSYREKKKK